MNATMFYALLMIAALAMGVFSFLVGGKSAQVRAKKEAGDEHGYHSTIEDLVKMCAGAIVVLAGAVVTVLTFVIAAPGSLVLPDQWVGDPAWFAFNLLFGIGATALLGFFAGVEVYRRGTQKSAASQTKRIPVNSFSIIGAFGLFVGLLALVDPAAAATCITEQMQPVTDILTWGGNDMMPAVLVLILAAVPLIMVMIGVRFAGGMLTGLLEGIREIFTFKF